MNERSELVEKALAMLTAAPRRTPSTPVTDWRDLASITAGLEADDARLTPVLAGLAQCQKAHEAGDVDRLVKASEHVRRLMLFAPGSQVRWHGHQGHRLMVLGPATVEHVLHDGSALWAFVTWRELGRWVADRIIVSIEGMTT